MKAIKFIPLFFIPILASSSFVMTSCSSNANSEIWNKIDQEINSFNESKIKIDSTTTDQILLNPIFYLQNKELLNSHFKITNIINPEVNVEILDAKLSIKNEFILTLKFSILDAKFNIFSKNKEIKLAIKNIVSDQNDEEYKTFLNINNELVQFANVNIKIYDIFLQTYKNFYYKPELFQILPDINYSSISGKSFETAYSDSLITTSKSFFVGSNEYKYIVKKHSFYEPNPKSGFLEMEITPSIVENDIYLQKIIKEYDKNSVYKMSDLFKFKYTKITKPIFSNPTSSEITTQINNNGAIASNINTKSSSFNPYLNINSFYIQNKTTDELVSMQKNQNIFSAPKFPFSHFENKKITFKIDTVEVSDENNIVFEIAILLGEGNFVNSSTKFKKYFNIKTFSFDNNPIISSK
ncbi:MAG: hypothetical protein ACRCRZ_03150 [Metamycoplasmataceae bacterium]